MRSPRAPLPSPVDTGSEIELAVNLGDPTDEFVLGGTAGADLLSAGTKGVSFTPDTDLDVTFLPLPGAIELAGGAGNDTLTSGGGYGTAQAFLGRAILRGEGDDDALGGSRPDDVIVGGPGADTAPETAGNDELLGEGGAATPCAARTETTGSSAGPVWTRSRAGTATTRSRRPTARPTR